MDRNQVLNEIKKFAERYKIEEALNKIGSLDAKSDENYVRLTVKECLAIIYKFVLESIDEELDLEDNLKCETTLNITKGQFDSIMVAIDNKKGYFMKTHNFLKFASVIMNRYSKDYKKEVATSEELVIVEESNPEVEESNPELDRKISVNGKRFATAVGIVIVGGAIIACATKCSNKPIANNDSKTLNNDIQKEDTIKPGISTPSNNEPVVNNTEQEELSDLEVATLKTYENWSNITDKYTVDDVREVVKALNGLESSITIEEADDVLTDVIEMVIFPKFNSMSGIEEFNLIGLKAQPKVLNLNTLYIDKEMTRVDNYLNSQVGMMNSVMNGLILGEKELDYAKASLTLELDVLANGKLDNATPIEKILFSRMAVYTNVLAAPLTPSDAYDNLSSSLNDLANEAMKGLNK